MVDRRQLLNSKQLTDRCQHQVTNLGLANAPRNHAVVYKAKSGPGPSVCRNSLSAFAAPVTTVVDAST
jgi:hypothetical protein